MHKATSAIARATVALLVAATGCGGGDSTDNGDSGDSGDDHGGGGAAARPADATGAAADADADARAVDRCDLGFNTTRFNESTTLVERPPSGDDPGRHDEPDHGGDHGRHAVDFTVEEWAEVFADPSVGPSADELVANVHATPGQLDAVLGGDLTPSLRPDPWVPMDDPAACATLAEQLGQARAAARRYPTVADALAAGYRPGSVYAPGQGAHFTNVGNIIAGFDPSAPDLLMYDGDTPDAELVGLAYYVLGPDTVPEGFTGPNDGWHLHRTLCRNTEGVAVSDAECAAGRATRTEEGAGWMTHAWVVPGCESDWGMFSPANPALPVLRPDAPFASGCNTGKDVNAPLTLDHPGGGPTVDPPGAVTPASASSTAITTRATAASIRA